MRGRRCPATVSRPDDDRTGPHAHDTDGRHLHSCLRPKTIPSPLLLFMDLVEFQRASHGLVTVLAETALEFLHRAPAFFLHLVEQLLGL